MKHLLKLDELYKSTYKSAADKLKSKHLKRSGEIMKWASERGESELKKVHVERQHNHTFVFDNYKSLEDRKDNFLGKFYITGHEQVFGLRIGKSQDEYSGVDVIMTSDWGVKISIKIVYTKNPFKIFHTKIKFNYRGGKFEFERDFLFNNRKDAIEIRKYLVDNVDSIFSKMSLNDIYTSD